MLPILKGKVAIVTGASRGAGRGIAIALGEAAATVYVTGRSVRGQPTTEGLPGTIDDTAAAITQRGGIGIPIFCDHTIDAEIESLFARVKREQGSLDLLVNNVWGGNETPIQTLPFWEQSLRHWEEMFLAGVRAHIVASQYAAKLMLPQRQGLIVNTTFWDGDRYTGHFFYDLAKNTLNRMAFGMAQDLRPHGITAIALSPGWLRTERVEAACDPQDLALTESVFYIGRAIVALATDPAIHAKTGQTLRVAELAQHYGFTDVDGRQPGPFHV